MNKFFKNPRHLPKQRQYDPVPALALRNPNPNAGVCLLNKPCNEGKAAEQAREEKQPKEHDEPVEPQPGL